MAGLTGLALCPRLLLPALLIAAGRAGAILPNCNPQKLGECPGSNQMCNKRVCECVKGYVYDSQKDECTKSHPDDVPDHSSATSLIVTVVTLTLIICALILVVRRYNLVNWLRHKINRRDNSVMYEDVMIGQDDTPIAA